MTSSGTVEIYHWKSSENDKENWRFMMGKITESDFPNKYKKIGQFPKIVAKNEEDNCEYYFLASQRSNKPYHLDLDLTKSNRSSMVGDIIVVNGTPYVCAFDSWKKLKL